MTGTQKRRGLYESLLRNFLPPLAALVVMLWAMLGLVYISAVFGGQAWIDAAKTGMLPQVLELVELQGTTCLEQEVRFGTSVCTGDGSSVVLRLQPEDSELDFRGQALSADGLTSLRDEEPVSGFGVVQGRAVQIAARPQADGTRLVLIRDVTEMLLHRLSTAGAVEVELFGRLDQPSFASTFQSPTGEVLSTTSSPPSDGMRWRDFSFDGEYRGYTPRSDQGWNFDRGATALTAFARVQSATEVRGLQGLNVVISVPKSVMLGYTNWMVLASGVAVVVLLVWAFWLLRRLTQQQIQPIEKLAARVQQVRRSLNTEDEDTKPMLRDGSTELESLEFAFGLLVDKIKENARLERQMRQHERLEAIGRLTGGIAHDFNNLLNIVVANCSFLEEDVSDPAVLESVADISAAAQSATEMTKALLAFSSGRGAASVPEGRDISGEVKTAVKLVARTIGSEVVLDTRIREEVCASVSGAQLQQMIMNLILNARDAARDETVEVMVALEPANRPPPHRPNDSPDLWVCLSVTDNGTGMSEAVKERIFEPFFSSKDFGADHGTGLGLSVVYGIVEGIGGAIDVDSTEGEGSTFTVFLPRADSVVKEDEFKEVAGPFNMSVMLVEDDYGVRRVVRAMLGRMGLDVVDFESGMDARRALESDPDFQLDALVTDIRMPGMDGYEVAEMCRARIPDLPVVFMTGFDPDADRRRQFENSILLMKPMRREDLGAALKALSALG